MQILRASFARCFRVSLTRRERYARTVAVSVTTLLFSRFLSRYSRSLPSTLSPHNTLISSHPFLSLSLFALHHLSSSSSFYFLHPPQSIRITPKPLTWVASYYLLISLTLQGDWLYPSPPAVQLSASDTFLRTLLFLILFSQFPI